MGDKEDKQIELHNFEPSLNQFRIEILEGLQKLQKELPSKYLYDERGSHLFDRICTLDEYYIPCTEKAIMDAYIEQIVAALGPNILLIEYGSGNSSKTRILLDHLPEPAGYVPIDISRNQLSDAASELASDYPEVEILPVCADYTNSFELPTPKRSYERKVVYFPGSTIGNFDPIWAKRFLKHVAAVCGPGGGLLIGVDLKKDLSVLQHAYDDRHGVTAAFNLNLLERINHELDGDFQLESFKYHAFYNPKEGRVEMHLVSQREQSVHLDNTTITFAKGESIWTESSYKFTINEFEQIAAAIGLKVQHIWTDEQQWFSVQYLVNTGGTTL